VWWPLSPYRVLALSNDPVGVKVVHKTASAKEVEQVRATYIRGAESMIIASPGDMNLPVGKRLARRPQLQVDCKPVDVNAAKCSVRFGWATAAR